MRGVAGPADRRVPQRVELARARRRRPRRTPSSPSVSRSTPSHGRRHRAAEDLHLEAVVLHHREVLEQAAERQRRRRPRGRRAARRRRGLRTSSGRSRAVGRGHRDSGLGSLPANGGSHGGIQVMVATLPPRHGRPAVDRDLGPPDAARHRLAVLPRLLRRAGLDHGRPTAPRSTPCAACWTSSAGWSRSTDPTHLACCWDNDWRPQWRVDLIPCYKAHRVEHVVPGGPDVEEVPDPLEAQIPVIVDGARGFRHRDRRRRRLRGRRRDRHPRHRRRHAGRHRHR